MIHGWPTEQARHEVLHDFDDYNMIFIQAREERPQKSLSAYEFFLHRAYRTWACKKKEETNPHEYMNRWRLAWPG